MLLSNITLFDISGFSGGVMQARSSLQDVLNCLSFLQLLGLGAELWFGLGLRSVVRPLTGSYANALISYILLN